jgi:3-phenylpropionate/trans-cinnamate dioxygenase ferredoxin reductase subunit
VTAHAQSSVLVVGASAAGMATVTALRRRGHTGRITVLGDEVHVPYDRPPLSKHYLADQWGLDRLDLVPTARLADLDLDLRLGVRAVSLDRGHRVVRDAEGVEHLYDELVIATGLRSRMLPDFPAETIHLLRTVDDAGRLRKALGAGRHLVVIGAGFIGLETAATATKLGATVTVVEPMTQPLSNRLGAYTADRLLALHRGHGVEVRVGVTATGVTTDGDGRSVVRLSTGDHLRADAVLLAVGSVPNAEWLEGSGVIIDDGVVCDEFSRAAEHVWAAGDIARWKHVAYGRSIRVEHRTNATEQGQQVAAGILGHLAPYTPVPFFWSDQFEAKIQLAGTFGPDSVETHLDVEGKEGSYLRLFHEEGRLVAALGWNAVRELNDYRRELARSVTTEEVVA